MPGITISQIAEVAEVSKATVSFVLNGRQRTGGSISESTAERVRQAARELGYRPNRTARALVTGKSNLMGLCMWNLADPHYSSVARHMESLLRNSENHLLVSCLRAQLAENDEQLLQSTFPWPLDGVLALEACHVLARHWDKYHSWPAPMVSMGGTHYQSPHLDYVGIDLAQGVREAVRHLLEINCRRIAFVAPPRFVEEEEMRIATYANSMQQANCAPEYISVTDLTRKSARQDVGRYIDEKGCPDGIICFNDNVAIGSYRALRDRHLDVPRQVALVGCDGIEDVEYLDCPITTIIQPVEEMCRLAWQMLQERIANPRNELQRKVLLPRLAIRESTAGFGGGNT